MMPPQKMLLRFFRCSRCETESRVSRPLGWRLAEEKLDHMSNKWLRLEPPDVFSNRYHQLDSLQREHPIRFLLRPTFLNLSCPQKHFVLAETWTGSSSGRWWNLSSGLIYGQSWPANGEPVRAAWRPFFFWGPHRRHGAGWRCEQELQRCFCGAVMSCSCGSSLFPRWPDRKETVRDSGFSKEPKPGPGTWGTM